jgi:uncharacterized protein (DUF58 family)
VRPTLRSLLVFLAGVPLSLVAVLVDAHLWTLWVGYLVLALLAIGADAVLAVPARRLRITWQLPEQLYIGDRGIARIELHSRWRIPARVELLGELAETFENQPALRAELRDHAVIELPLVPRRRGEHALEVLHVRWGGPLGLIERRIARRIGTSVAVVPNLGNVRAMALRMFSDRSFMAGLKVERYLGDGSEFDALREYLPGLDHRTIDWKASARHRKLLCQDFRAERNHQVVLAVDSGQLMTEPLGGVPKVDLAINAALLLAWFCLRTGDRVGLAGFDERVRTWIDPAGGMQSFTRLQSVSAEIDYSHVETNYTLTLAELSTRVRRRSLIVLFTDFLDTVSAELMIDNVTRLARRHLVLFVSIRDPSLETMALVPPRTLLQLHQSVVASDFTRERTLVLDRLRAIGAHCIDTTPREFSMAIVNRYLEIKRRELF